MIKYKIAIAIVIILKILGLGFLSKPDTVIISRIDTSHVCYQIANYSETIVSVDVDGHAYLDTDYWNEQVSESWFIDTTYDYDGFFVIDYYGNVKSKLKVDDPPITIEHTKNNFDDYTIISKLNIMMWFDTNGNKEDFISVKPSEYSKACSMIGKSVKVKTWYGIRYSEII